MNFDAVTIERMVREVLSQTQAAASARGNTAADPTSAATTKPQATLLTVPVVAAPLPAVERPSTAVVIADRIITADLIKEQAKPGSTIVITRQAIVTPAAQDFLRNAKITIERREVSASGASQSAVRWKMLVSGVAEHSLRAIDAVCQQRSNAQRELTGETNEAVKTAISAICRAEVAGVIVVTNKPETVACLANRQEVIRAAVITDLACWSRVQPDLKPNVICITPQNRSFMELQNILNKIVTSPSPAVGTNN